MMLLLPVPLIQLLASAGGARGYSSINNYALSAAGLRQQRRRPALSPVVAAAAGPFSSSRSSAARTRLDAGLRDLVGPYNDDYYVDYGGGMGGTGSTPYVAPSIRDERNSAFDRGGGFGSGGYASGGNGGVGFGRRNSPGFVGFGRDNRNYRSDGNYPDYDVVIDATPPPRGVDYDVDLPGSATRRIGNNYGYGGGPGYYSSTTPYDRGLSSDFINTNGSRRTGGTRTVGVGRNNFNDFDDYDIPPTVRLPESRSFGRRGVGRRNLPQVYRRDYLDSFNDRREGGRLARRGLRSLESLTVVERYFEAWNRRNIPLALSCFDDEVYYDDTQFSEPFDGKDKLADHLLYVADCLPDSFYFVVDELSVGSARSTGGGSRLRRRDAASTFQLGRGGRGDRLGRREGYLSSSLAATVNVGALWHIENEFGPLPFARGCSFFKVDPRTDLIVEAYDFPEPAVIKTGSTGLRILSVASKLVSEPTRWFPFFAWATYVYVIFFSNGILPGNDLLHADPKTWQEVSDLSFNFMFVAPVTHMPTAAKLNPVLEGIFNGLLAWSFMFAGFLSDERSGMGPYGKDSRYYERMVREQERVLDNGIVLVPPVSIAKKNLIPFVPTIVAMQFFMAGSLLPYLFARTSERYSSEIEFGGGNPRLGNLPRRIRPLYKEELDRPALVLGEWRGLGILLGAVGIFALYWGFAGRPEDFGPPIWVSDKRMVDFMKLLDKDRVAASFVVNLWTFGIFQGWLVDDDWKRRGRSMDEEKFLRNVAKFVPFFGLASYLVFRPRYPSSRDGFDYEGFFSQRDSVRRGGPFTRGGGRGDGGRFGNRN